MLIQFTQYILEKSIMNLEQVSFKKEDANETTNDAISIISLPAGSLQIQEPEVKDDAETIISNISNKARPWHTLYVFIILGACIMWLSIVTLIPRQNSILYPDYWYDSAIVLVLCITTTYVLGQGMESTIYTNSIFLITFKRFFSLCLWIMLACVVGYGISYVVWVMFLGYNHPMPLLALCVSQVSWIVSLVAIWLLFPTELRSKTEYKKKLTFYIFYELWYFFMLNLNQGLNVLFEALSLDLQWIMAFVIPLFREINHWILSKIITKSAGNDNEAANVLLDVSVSTSFGTFVAVQLASANNITVYSFLGVEFSIHMFICFQIIHFKRKIDFEDITKEDMRKMKKQKLMNLLLSEIVEALVPLAYAIGVALAFYGPNKSFLGSVKKLHENDVERLFIVMFLMFFIDLVCIAVSGIILWISGNVNLLDEVCKIIRKYWFIFAIRVGGNISWYFGSNDINLGMDYNLNFEWITDEGRLRIIQNTTHLSSIEKTF